MSEVTSDAFKSQIGKWYSTLYCRIATIYFFLFSNQIIKYLLETLSEIDCFWWFTSSDVTVKNPGPIKTFIFYMSILLNLLNIKFYAFLRLITNRFRYMNAEIRYLPNVIGMPYHFQLVFIHYISCIICSMEKIKPLFYFNFKNKPSPVLTSSLATIYCNTNIQILWMPF